MDAQDSLSRAKARFEAEGFTVRLNDQSLALAAADAAPDAVARRGGETVLLAVVRPGGGKAEERRLARLAELADTTPGMAFELVLEEAPGAAGAPALEAPSLAEMKATLALARRLAGEGQGTAALLLAWPVLEAAARRAARLQAKLDTAPLAPPDFLDADSLAAALVSEGFIPDADHAWVADLGARAQALAHGALGCPVPADALARLLSLAEMLARPDVLTAGVLTEGARS